MSGGGDGRRVEVKGQREFKLPFSYYFLHVTNIYVFYIFCPSDGII